MKAIIRLAAATPPARSSSICLLVRGNFSPSVVSVSFFVSSGAGDVITDRLDEQPAAMNPIATAATPAREPLLTGTELGSFSLVTVGLVVLMAAVYAALVALVLVAGAALGGI